MKLVIAGGGTGGHLFPGIAVAEELVSGSADSEVLFVGTARGLEARELARWGYPLRLISATALRGKGLLGLLLGCLRLPVALVQSLRLLRHFRPQAVLGVGGYASGPVLLAARLLGLPTAIQEQNARAGFTNRLLGRFVQLVFTAFAGAGAAFPRGKVRQLGNPIRRALLDNFLAPNLGRDPSRFSILVLGGSQGAHALNLAVPEALATVPAELRARLRVLHQTGARDLASVAARLSALGLAGEAVDFIVDVSKAYADSNLVVARAGAGTLAELTVCQRASILVPFPSAADDHQTANARTLVEAGAALLLPEAELTPARLGGLVAALAADPARLAAMERAAAHLGRPEASREIVDVLLQLASGDPNPGRKASPTRPPEK